MHYEYWRFNMRKLKIKKGFTLIELIVVIAVLGILVLLAGPKLLGYTEKAQLTRIQHDTKVMEQEMEQVLIEDETKINSWDNNGKELGVLVMQEKLFEKEGIAKNVKRNYDTKNNSTKISLASADNSNLGVGGEEYGVNGKLTTSAEDAEENDGDGYKIVPNDYKDKIKTKLKGTFYTNDNGKVYYENDKPLKVDKNVGISCESPEALPDYEFDHATGTIKKWNGTAEHLVIPHEFKNADTGECTTVRIIGKGAFMQGGFKSVVIPDTVKIIEENAFKDNELTEIYIPHSVTEVGSGAFDNNFITSGSGSYGNKNTVFVGSNSGGDSGAGGGSGSGSGGSGTGGAGNGGNISFEQNGAGGTSSVTPSYKAPSSSDVDVIFNSETGTIVSGGTQSGVTQQSSKHGLTKDEITIPNEINVGGINYPVKEIAKGAYQGLGLKSVVLPSGLERIEDYSFAGNQLKGVAIPDQVSYVGNYAFAFNEKTNSGDGTKIATIKNIKMKNGTELEEQFSKLGKYGNIEVGGKKAAKVGIIELKDFIFVTSIDNHVIDEEYVGSNPASPSIPVLPDTETSGGIYSEEKIAELINEGEYIEVSTPEELNKVRNGLSGKYIQTKDIDLSGYSAGEGWKPIGNSSARFAGTYDGGGFKITGLTINRTTNNVGLFGYTEEATISNVVLEDIKVTGKGNYVGGLVGVADQNTTISNSYATGSVTGSSAVGGLVGYAQSSTTISNSYSTGSVTGGTYSGGLVGWAHKSTINNSYATGSVEGTERVGGLVGQSQIGAKISNSYAIGSVKGISRVGGLVGGASSNSIENSYSTGKVTGRDYVGGLVGGAGSSGTSNSYWNRETTGQSTSAGGVGMTTIQMKAKSTYVNLEFDTSWDFKTIWQIEEGVSYPTLRQQK